MADYTVVGGDANNSVKKMFEGKKDINIVNTFADVKDLSQEVINNGTSFLQVVDSVIVIDYGFSSMDAKDRANDFVFLQDILRSNALRDTKLYLITKDTNLYSLLRSEVDGIPGVHYINTQVLLIEGTYAPKLLGDIFKGRRDKTGLYHPDIDKQNMTQRMRDDRDTFIEDSKSVSREILEYGKNIPVSELSKTDYTDSPAVERAILQKERERSEKEKKAKEKSKKDAASNRTEVPEVTKKPSIKKVKEVEPVLTPPKPIEVVAATRKAPNISRMKEAFRTMGQSNVLKGKLEGDSGVLAFVGERKSGTSGIVANLADVYAYSGKNVLVVDMDVINRTQTRYFRNYDEQVDNHYGLGNGLLKAAQGASLQRAVVQITSRVAVLGTSMREKVSETMIQEIASELGTILEAARQQYDVVLVDVPNEYLGMYLDGLLGTDKNLLVVENRWYDLESFIDLTLGKHLEDNEEGMVRFFNKSTLVLNKFRRGQLDREGEELTRPVVIEGLRKRGYPYDRIGVAGEIPYYDQWEDQYLTGVRYIWEDRLAMGVYKQVFSKVVW